MSTLELVYIMAALAIGFLAGMIVETFVDNKTICDLKDENRMLRDENQNLKAQPATQTIEILDRRGIEADELFKPF